MAKLNTLCKESMSIYDIQLNIFRGLPFTKQKDWKLWTGSLPKKKKLLKEFQVLVLKKQIYLDILNSVKNEKTSHWVSICCC